MAVTLNMQGRFIGLASRPWTKLRVGFLWALDHNASFDHYRFLVGVATNNFSLMYPGGPNGAGALEGAQRFYGIDFGWWDIDWTYNTTYFVIGNVGSILLANAGIHEGINGPTTETRNAMGVAQVSAVVATPSMFIAQFYKNGANIDVYYWNALPNALWTEDALWEQIQLPIPSGVMFTVAGGGSIVYGAEDLTSLVLNWNGNYDMHIDSLMAYRYE